MGEPLRVLVVEDSERDANALLEELRRGGFDPVFRRVDTAEAMEDALEGETWDLILADYVMPEFSGLTALLLVQDRGLDLPFILVSGMISDELAVEAMRLGAQDYIEKSNLSRLLPAVTRELREAEVRRERRHVEEELRKNLRFLESLMNTIPSPVFYKDTEGRYLGCNQRFADEILGVPKEQIIGRTVFELPGLISPMLAKVHDEHDRQLVQGSGIQVYESQAQSPGGRVRDFLVHKTVFSSLDGSAGGIVGVMLDISERKKMERELREKEEKYRSLFEMESDVILMVDSATGRILEVNPAGPALYGYSRSELLHMKEEDLSSNPLENRQDHERCPSASIQMHRKKDGTVFPVESILRHFDWGGRNVYVVAIRDITERLSAQEEIERQHLFLREVIDTSPNHIYVKDAQGRLVLCNRNFAEFLGIEPDELVGKTISQIRCDCALAHISDQDDLTILRGDKERTEREGLSADRHGNLRHIYIIAVPILDRERMVRGVVGIGMDITGIKQAEAALRESEERYRTLFDQVPVGLFRVTPEGRILDANPALIRMLGYPDRNALIARDVADLYFHPSNRPYEPFQIDPVRSVFSFELQMCCFGGETIWVRGTARVVRDNAGNDRYYEGSLEDITERKLAEKALEKRMRYDKALTAASRVMLAEPDVDTSLRQALQTLQAAADVDRVYLYENDLDEQKGLCARRVCEICAPDRNVTLDSPLFTCFSYAQVLPRWAVTLSEGGPISGLTESFPEAERDLLRSRGALSVLVLPLWVSGQWHGFLGVEDTRSRRAWGVEDVRLLQSAAEMIGFQLGRVQAEAELRRLLQAIEQAAEAILITSPDGHVEYVNPAFERITGYTRDEIVGDNLASHRNEYQDAPFYDTLLSTIRAGQVWKGRCRGEKKGGGMHEEDVTVSPVVETTGRIVNYVAVARDVSRETQLERQLQQAQKMEAIGQLAGGVAHDFNNLLQGITGYTHLVMENLEPEDPRSVHLKEVFKAAERAAALVRQLLAFSRQQVAEPQALDLNDAITDMTRMLRRLIGENIELELLLGESLRAVYADPAQITQVLVNLCVNARDAMPDGGRITIESRNVTFGFGEPGGPAGDHVLVAVSDTGPGIPPELQERVFEPFFTTKEVGKGTGLGLAVVYGIIKQHKGSIRLISQTGHGTRFEIHLPALDRAVPPPQEQTPPSPAPGGSETILVAEDDAVVRQVIVQVLENAGYHVLIAADGEEAINLFTEHANKIDLALLDVVMPKVGGIVVYERIREARPELPVVFSSAHHTELDIPCPKHGPVRPLRKPYRPEELLHAVREALYPAPRRRDDVQP